MKIYTTPLGYEIVKAAEAKLASNCLEKSNRNDGDCIYNLIKEVYPQKVKGSPNKPQIPYCATTASHILFDAFAKYGVEPIIHSPMSKDLLAQAKKQGIRIDKKPAPGSIVLTKSSWGMHTALCWYNVDDKVFGTIEGNTSGYLNNGECFVKAPKDGVVAKQRSELVAAIHIEEVLGEDLQEFEANVPGSASGISDNDFCLTDIPVDNSKDEDSPDGTDNRIILVGTVLAAIAFGFFVYEVWDKK